MSTQVTGFGTASGSGANTITVLVSTAVHPLSGRPCTSRNDTLALETARQLSGGALRTLHVGDPQDAALPDYLAFGANCVEVLPVAPGDDAIAALAERVHSAKLVLCGTRAQSGESSGMLPYLLAAALKRPILADVLEAQLVGDSVKVTQFLPKGRRRTVTVSLPAIIAVHPLATAAPRYAYARRVAGRIETLTSLTSDASAAASRPSPWTLESVDRVPVKLRASDRRSGHARMLAATAAASRGGQVVTEGSDVEKAQAVLAYLREHDLIAF
jgi:electron transfer flavoprotein beta subunit